MTRGPRKSTPDTPKLTSVIGWPPKDFGKNAQKMRKCGKMRTAIYPPPGDKEVPFFLLKIVDLALGIF